MLPTEAPQAPVQQFHDITITTTKKYGRARVLGIPPEEFGIERSARTIADANYAFHDIVNKTEGEWIAEGFDEDMIRSIPGYTGASDTETLSRDTASEHDSSQNALTRTARIVPITEHYIRMDYEGDGKTQLYMVITATKDGGVLVKDGKDCIYPIDVIPIAATTPVPQTHRFIGRSIADLIMDIQRIKTALLRGGLDNLYLHNSPRPVVAEDRAGPNTIDDILNVRQGSPIRVKTGSQDAITWQNIPDITPSVFPMMQYMDAIRETRTGMSQQSQGLDANALQNQSATAVAQVFSASQMRLKLIARLLAEGLKDVFSLLHGTIRQHGQQAQTVRLRNTWVEVDPRNWKTRDDMTIHVGLGNGDKAQQYAQIMGIANVQKELIAGGKAHLVPDQQLFNTVAELVKLTGHKNPDKFFADPSEKNPDGSLKNPPLPPPPDPKVAAIQAKAQVDQGAAAQKAQLEQQQAQLDAVHQQVKMQADVQLAQIKAELDAKLKILDAHLQAAQVHQSMGHAAQAHKGEMVGKAVDIVATAHAHDTKMDAIKNAPKGDGK